MIREQNATGSPSGSAGQGDEQTVTAKDLFEVLANPSQRRVLRELHETEGRVGLHELAERTDDLGDERTDRPSDDPDRLAIRLHHSHLPKLDDCGLADYDSESHTVVAEIPARVEPHLDAVTDE
jgi:hypothetical protein